MRSQTLGKIQEQQAGSKSFSDWLLSPSLYSSGERVRSKTVLEYEVSAPEGRIYELETDSSVYKFFYPRQGFLRADWPRLKHQLLHRVRYETQCLQGIRFLRTVGDLPIWLDNGPRSLRLNTKLPAHAEIACIIEKRPTSRYTLEEVLERGISQAELQELAEFICALPPANIEKTGMDKVGVGIATSLPNELLPYYLALRSHLEGLQLHASPGYSPSREATFSGLYRKNYVDGSSSWSLSERPSREELFFLLRRQYGAQFAAALLRRMPEKICAKSVALVGYQMVDSGDTSAAEGANGDLLRSAMCELYVGEAIQEISLIVLSGTPNLAEELCGIFHTELFRISSSQESAAILAQLRGPVLYAPAADGLLVLEIVQELTRRGKMPIVVQESGVDFGALIEVSPALSLPDQTVQVLEGISSLLLRKV